MASMIIQPTPDDPALTQRVVGRDHTGAEVALRVVVERPLTVFLNDQEIVTMMTIGDYPAYLAVGYLANQNMVRADDNVTGVDHDPDLGVVVVRTERKTDYEDKLKRKTLTSGCAVGTVFGDVMERFDQITLPTDRPFRTSWLYALTRTVNTTPSLYLAAGAIHGCVLCREDRAQLYFEDVGRHNAVDKLAGYMRTHGLTGADKAIYTTGRLTSEMVIKTVQMEIPVLISRSGFTAWGVELARSANLTLVGRAKGRRFTALAGLERLDYDADPATVADEPMHLGRKAAGI